MKPSVPPPAAAKASSTRKSIKTYFPLGHVMCKGSNNPITMHSVNEDVFASVWSLIAEVMITQGEITRYTRECIANLVSSKNQCPMCVTAHNMIGTAAKLAEQKESRGKREEDLKLDIARHEQALQYAEYLIDTQIQQQTDAEQNYNPAADLSDDQILALSEVGRAEVALVVLLFNHMNRTVSSILGEQMSTAMFSVPTSAAKRMESSAVMGVMNKMMSPFLAKGMQIKHKQGITKALFPSTSSFLDLMPEHLEGAELAGMERANALSRIVVWVAFYEKQLLGSYFSKEIVYLLEDPASVPPPDKQSHHIAHWVTVEMCHKLRALPDKKSQCIAHVLLLLSYSPQSVFRSVHWLTVVKELGKERATTLLIWWSLRFTLNHAMGLKPPTPQNRD